MAALSTTNPTLLDQIKRTDPNGAIAKIVEMLSQQNAIIQDATSVEGNLTTGDRITRRSGLPTLGWRKLNSGIPYSKSETEQFDETAGLLEGFSRVDCELAKLNGNEAAFRASEDASFMESMDNEVSTGLFYHSTDTAPEKFHGLSDRFGQLGTTGIQNYVVDGGGSGAADQYSMWFVTWHPDTCYTIFPKAMKGGIETIDMGKQVVEDGNGNPYLAYVTNWKWRIGLALKDYRYNVRLCNIDATTNPTDLIDLMVEAYNKIWSIGKGRQVIYVNRAVRTILDKEALNKANHFLTMGSWFGKPITMFREMPIRLCDALILEDEITT